MHAFALTGLLAQQAPSPQFAWALGGLAAFLGFATVYLVLVSLPMLRSSLEHAQGERDAALIQLDGQSANALKQLDTQRRDAAIQLEEQRRALERQIDELNNEVARLRKLAEQPTQIPRLKRELCDSKLAAHVNHGLANRLEADLYERQAAATACQHKAQAELTAAHADASTLKAKLQDAKLEIHVRRGIQDRLEANIRQLDGSLSEGNSAVAELSERVESIQAAVRSQSEAMINTRLAAAERESEHLRHLRDQIGSADLSPQAILQAIANGRPSNEP